MTTTSTCRSKTLMKTIARITLVTLPLVVIMMSLQAPWTGAVEIFFEDHYDYIQPGDAPGEVTTLSGDVWVVGGPGTTIVTPMVINDGAIGSPSGNPVVDNPSTGAADYVARNIGTVVEGNVYEGSVSAYDGGPEEYDRTDIQLMAGGTGYSLLRWGHDNNRPRYWKGGQEKYLGDHMPNVWRTYSFIYRSIAGTYDEVDLLLDGVLLKTLKLRDELSTTDDNTFRVLARDRGTQGDMYYDDVFWCRLGDCPNLGPPASAPCDFDSDQLCNVNDINLMFTQGDLVAGVADPGGTSKFNLTGDTSIDGQDISRWLELAAENNGYGTAPYLRGDTDHLGNISPAQRTVDITDFNALADNYAPMGTVSGVFAPNWHQGSFDGDGDVDLTDFNFLAGNYDTGSYGAGQAGVTPEPTAALLLAIGGLFLAMAGSAGRGNR